MTITHFLAFSLISCVGMTCLISPSVAADEQRLKPRVAVLVKPMSPIAKGLIQGLRELGYADGSNIAIEWRGTAATTGSEWREIAADLARSQPAVVVAGSTPAARAVLDATTLPVVFFAGDPVASGLVTSLARPGGNATGVSLLTTQLTVKRLELLRRAAPRSRRVIFLMNSSNPAVALQLREVRDAARTLDLELVTVDVLPGAVDLALAKLLTTQAGAILVAADLFFLDSRAKIAQAILKSKLPAIFPATEYHDAGVLLTYGPNLTVSTRRLAAYVDKILKGAKPSELPVEQLAKYELVIDLRVAGAMGYRVPQELIDRADEILR